MVFQESSEERVSEALQGRFRGFTKVSGVFMSSEGVSGSIWWYFRKFQWVFNEFLSRYGGIFGGLGDIQVRYMEFRGFSVVFQ